MYTYIQNKYGVDFMGKFKDITGQTFGELTVIENVGSHREKGSIIGDVFALVEKR